MNDLAVHGVKVTVHAWTADKAVEYLKILIQDLWSSTREST